MGERCQEVHGTTGTTGVLENSQNRRKVSTGGKRTLSINHHQRLRTVETQKNVHFYLAFSGFQNLPEAKEKNGKTEETDYLSAKGKGKMFLTHLRYGEWRTLRKPKSFLLFIYMYEYFVVFHGRKQFSNCIRRLILLNRCSFILFNRKIILFNYNPICKQRIFSH